MSSVFSACGLQQTLELHGDCFSDCQCSCTQSQFTEVLP